MKNASIEPKPKFMSDKKAEEIYGIGRGKLAKLRFAGKGPEFRRFGHRTVRYNVEAFEAWIAEQPRGGERV
jgi:hypothetical protein